VCKENAYKSQIAEALFNHLTVKHGAISTAGAKPAAEISEDVATILKKEYGIDMHDQASKTLTKNMLDSADRIIIVRDPIDCVLLPKRYSNKQNTGI
jgi:arsenate reductase